MNASLRISLSRPCDSRVVRALRLAGNLTLAQAQAIAQTLEGKGEVLLASGLSEESAAHLSRVLGEAGLTCSLSESDLETPMLIFPDLNKTFTWSALRTIKKS